MITGHRVVLGARLLAAALLLASGYAYWAFPHAGDPVFGVLAYAFAAMLFLAFPHMRSGDLATVAVCLFSVSELVGRAGPDRSRWLLTMAAIGAATIPLRAQRIRAAACRNGYAPLVERRKRRAVEPPAASVILRRSRRSDSRMESKRDSVFR